MPKKLILLSVIWPCLMVCGAVPARALVVSTYNFTNCGFPDTGQKICYDDFGVDLVCPTPGDVRAQDGSYMPGAAQPGYTKYGASGSMVTVDNRTGLMWVTDPADPGLGGTYPWDDALTRCEDSTHAGYPDWRLPNARELMSIVDYGEPAAPVIKAAYFQGTQIDFYWTSTSYAPDAALAWFLDFTDGIVSLEDKTLPHCVRCVRGGP